MVLFNEPLPLVPPPGSFSLSPGPAVPANPRLTSSEAGMLPASPLLKFDVEAMISEILKDRSRVTGDSQADGNRVIDFIILCSCRFGLVSLGGFGFRAQGSAGHRMQSRCK
jgi:hypothetical protein